MRGGIVLRMSEIIKFATAHTRVTETAMTTAGFSCAVTANAEHTPKVCVSIGFSLFNGPKYDFMLVTSCWLLRVGYFVLVTSCWLLCVD